MGVLFFLFSSSLPVAASGDWAVYSASESRKGEGLGSREERFWASWGQSWHGQVGVIPLCPVKTGYLCNCILVSHHLKPAMRLIVLEVMVV